MNRDQFWHNVKTIAASAVIAGLAGGWVDHQINTGVQGIRGEINTFAQVSCVEGTKQSNAIIGKYNDVVAALITQNQDAEKLNLQRDDARRAAINAATIARLQGDQVTLPPPHCGPILR